MENYLTILEESLKQKLEILSRIQKSTEKQEDLLKEEHFSLETFDQCMDEKEELIQALNKLDDGFESVYARVSKQLQENRSLYQNQIKRMQDMIRQITDASNAIQVKEMRNKNLLEKQLSGLRKNLSEGQRNTTAFYNRYHNLNGAVTPQFMDQKQ